MWPERVYEFAELPVVVARAREIHLLPRETTALGADRKPNRTWDSSEERQRETAARKS